METILISACLLGVNCRYDGGSCLLPQISRLRQNYQLVPVCAEIFGGMTTPRAPSERKEGKVISIEGNDVTQNFERGAAEVLKLAQLYDCHTALLKEHSPSCGHGLIYDGSFSGTLVSGDGVTAALLSAHGIRILGESQIAQLL